MEENMADAGQVPGQALVNLYQQWADGGVGLILTGNVMVAPDAMTGPGGVYLCLLYTSPSPRDQRGSRMPSSA